MYAGHDDIQGGQLYMAVWFWYLVKSDECTAADTWQVFFYKVLEKKAMFMGRVVPRNRIMIFSIQTNVYCAVVLSIVFFLSINDKSQFSSSKHWNNIEINGSHYKVYISGSHHWVLIYMWHSSYSLYISDSHHRVRISGSRHRV